MKVILIYPLRVISDDTLLFRNIGIDSILWFYMIEISECDEVNLSTRQDMAFPCLWISDSFNKVQIHDWVITEVIKFV